MKISRWVLGAAALFGAPLAALGSNFGGPFPPYNMPVGPGYAVPAAGHLYPGSVSTIYPPIVHRVEIPWPGIGGESGGFIAPLDDDPPARGPREQRGDAADDGRPDHPAPQGGKQYRNWWNLRPLSNDPKAGTLRIWHSRAAREAALQQAAAPVGAAVVPPHESEDAMAAPAGAQWPQITPVVDAQGAIRAYAMAPLDPLSMPKVVEGLLALGYRVAADPQAQRIVVSLPMPALAPAGTE